MSLSVRRAPSSTPVSTSLPTPVVRVYRSNRTEVLADRLAELLGSSPLLGPFEPDTIVVQGRGMAVWLSQRLSLKHRISANTDFTYPRQVVLRAFDAVLGEAAVSEGAASEEGILWSVLSALPGLLPRPEFARVARYLTQDPRGVRHFQLADRIATRFDQYLTYRPEMIRAWCRGEDGGVDPEDAWQPLLFRALGGTLATHHVAALESQYREALRRGKDPTGFPRRLALFGLSSLPPLFLRVLSALAPHVDIHLFTFAPSPKDFWNHTRREDLVRALESGADPAALHLDVGSPLLASMGALGAEFETVLEQGLGEVGVLRTDEDHFVPPDAPGMLGAVQRTIYDLVSGPGDPHERVLFSETDPSVGVHSCHGPMREVEVLHDQLLALLTRDGSTLEPRDVVVMTPDVDAYAPFIEAVFDRARGNQYIPYRISDRSVRTDSPVVDAFQRVLGLVGGRAEASLVLDLLNLGPIQEKFGIDPNALEQITQWVVESGVRWGVDEADRAVHGQPRERQNTWRFGLDRLLLGYAMKTGGRHLVHGVLPFEEIEGKGAELLGSLAEFAERLFEVLANLEGARTLGDWRRDLGGLLAALIATDSRTAWQERVILVALDELSESARVAGFEDTVELEVVKALLERRIDTSYPERGFLSNGVTFCAMLPMRSIPFRVVCLLGMNDGAYPRSARPVDFDLIRKGGPRPGDRDRRKDDRYLFLEALMAARETFLVTYAGQSIRDNAARPPSVVVNELLDAVERIHGASAASGAGSASGVKELAALRDRLVVRHPLQGFSPRNFDGKDPRLFSFVEAYRSGAVHAAGIRAASPPFFEAPLAAKNAPGDGTAETVPLSELVRFYEDPVGYLLTRRLGVYLKDTGFGIDIPDREPIEVVQLDRWKLGDALLGESIEGLGDDVTETLARARGQLPLGRYGKLVHAETAELAREIGARAREYALVGRSPPVAVNGVLSDGTRLVGELAPLFGNGLLRHQFSSVRAKYQISHWVRHAVLCWAERPDARSVLVGQAEGKREAATVTFAPFTPSGGSKDELDAYLVKLVTYYRAGLSAPLRYTPSASLKYAEAVHKGRTHESALADARKAYGDADNGDRSYSPHLARVFGTDKPGFENTVAAAGDFKELAEDIVLPMLRRRTVS